MNRAERLQESVERDGRHIDESWVFGAKCSSSKLHRPRHSRLKHLRTGSLSPPMSIGTWRSILQVSINIITCLMTIICHELRAVDCCS